MNRHPTTSDPMGGGAWALPQTAAEWRNWRMMRLLERIAVRFNRAGVPLMALKGAALQLTVYHRPGERPMDDLDLLIKGEDVDRSFGLLEELGGLRGEPLVREDFFPRFYSEVEYRLGSIYPVKVDLHVRPFRPLRYAQTVPEHAFWDDAQRVRCGSTSILIPSRECMLIHLAAHAAMHDCGRAMWHEDIRRWVEAFGPALDWDCFLSRAKAWGLALPVRKTFIRTEQAVGTLFTHHVKRELAAARVCLADRLALWHAPRDAQHPVGHIMVNALSIPGLRSRLAYLRAILFPSRTHMADWYVPRHWAWLPCAHVLRWISPAISLLPRRWQWFRTIETRASSIHGTGVYATRAVQAGNVVARWHGRTLDRDGMYVMHHATDRGGKRLVELTGAMKFLNHSCRANTRLDQLELVAIRSVRAGEELTIDYGPSACRCRMAAGQKEGVLLSGAPQ